jgi:hypothetical protein
MLTPNDDEAEKAASRKRRQAERMRKSLAGSFEAADGGAAANAARLDDAELQTMLDLALKLAAENKITDRNVWSLALIDHLPEMVHSAAPVAAAAAAPDCGGTNYFTRISGGLDAGVQIYARRVDATWKQAYAQLYGGPNIEDGEREKGARGDLWVCASSAGSARAAATPDCSWGKATLG